MPSIFTRIIDGEIPGTFVWRDDVCVSFLSINPLSAGHALVVPRAEIDHWLDVDAATTSHLMTVAQTVGRAQMKAFAPRRVAMMIIGEEVPHVHLHVIPMHTLADVNFANAAPAADPADLEAAAEAIRTHL